MLSRNIGLIPLISHENRVRGNFFWDFHPYIVTHESYKAMHVACMNHMKL